MFTKLFKSPQAVVRYLSAPLLEERVRYLTHCVEQGSAPRTLKKIAYYQLAVTAYLDWRQKDGIRIEQIQSAADQWLSSHPAHCSRTDAQASRRAFTAEATHWLRFLNWLYVPPAIEPPFMEMVREFAADMRYERGLSSVTAYTRCKRVEEFLTRFCSDDRSLHDLSIADVDAAIAQKGTQDGCTRISIRTYAYVIRSFLRYAEERKWCKPGLAAAILPPRAYSFEGLPAGPTWEDVERLCLATAGERRADVRDHAVILFFAVYGFRVSEVRRLRLDDFDWQRELITISRSKQHVRKQTYPLSQTVGEAVLRYVKEVRPRCQHRELFLSLKAPVQPLGSSALWQIVRRRTEALKIATKHHGPHSLRHASATRLLTEGLSMKEVGDYLGHRNPAATSIYAKVNLAELRAVADFSLEGIL